MFKQKIYGLLKDKLTEEQYKNLEIPSGFQRIGDIIILTLKQDILKDKILTKEIGKAMLNIFPTVKTICIRTGIIKGKFRKPQLRVIATKDKKNPTETIHTEYGFKYKFDVAKIMWSKGNLNERIRIAKTVKSDQIVVDMFAGIGYFTIPISSKAKKVYAIELNPIAFHYLNENLKLNKIDNVIAINKDCKNAVLELAGQGVKADHIVMGLLPSCKPYLKYAMLIAKHGTIIHYEGLSNTHGKNLFNEVSEEASNHNFKAKLLTASRVKSYKPKVWHYTVDVMLSSN